MLDFESALESFAICTTPFLSGIARLGVSNWGRILDLPARGRARNISSLPSDSRPPRARRERSSAARSDKIASRMEAPVTEPSSGVRLGRGLALAAAALSLLFGPG